MRVSASLCAEKEATSGRRRTPASVSAALGRCGRSCQEAAVSGCRAGAMETPLLQVTLIPEPHQCINQF